MTRISRSISLARFDVVQQDDDATHFVLTEVFRTPADTWRDTVADMMAEPRTGVKYRAVFPDPADWDIHEHTLEEPA